MVTRNQVLSRAASQLGTRESPSGSNRQKYGVWYGMNGVPWCDIFVSWVFGTLSAGGAVGGKFAYCPYHLNWFVQRKRLYRTPMAGDLVFFRWDGMSVTGHIGIVEKVLSGGRIQTLEGNTSSDNTGSQNNGGGVYRRIRSSTANISGYGRPMYTSTSTATPTAATTTAVRSVTQTKAIQAAVRITQDGKWGPMTDKAVIAVVHKILTDVKFLQARIGTVQDGRWGPASELARLQTIKRIQTALKVPADGDWGARSRTAWHAARAANYGK